MGASSVLGKNRTALVTGASRGIGTLIARQIAGEGGHVVLTGRSAASLQAVTADLAASGADVSFIPADLTEGIRSFVNRLRPTAQIAWSPIENLHITTKFIGDWPEQRLDEMQRSLASIPVSGAIETSIPNFWPAGALATGAGAAAGFLLERTGNYGRHLKSAAGAFGPPPKGPSSLPGFRAAGTPTGTA